MTVATESLAGKRVLVMGLGRFGGGVGVARWLAGQGAVVTVNDAEPAEELAESVRALEGLPITFKLGGHRVEDFLATDLLVVNPAVDRAKSEVVQAAIAAGVPTTTEMNLFLERCPARTIGITGSVGKSTTTALIFAALVAGFGAADKDAPRVFLGGNIGKSLLGELDQMRAADWVVLELSSFMLEETPQIGRSPHIAVVTNVVPNHLDRHGTMAAYSAAKQNILRFQAAGDVAILNADHDLVARWVRFVKGKLVKFTTRGPAANRPSLVLPGEHNQSNAAAALAVVDAVIAESRAFDRAAALAAIERFPGLSHRLQMVHTLDVGGRQVRYYNDSKATTPEASITAVMAFLARTAVFIVGGFERQTDYAEFETLLAHRAGAVFGIGATGAAIVAHVAGMSSGLHAKYVETLEQAVAAARAYAAGDPAITAIVLSPASASWDQFANYEVRGDQFAALARQ